MSNTNTKTVTPTTSHPVRCPLCCCSALTLLGSQIVCMRGMGGCGSAFQR